METLINTARDSGGNQRAFALSDISDFDVRDAVNVCTVCIPVCKIHITVMPPMPTSRAMVASACPYCVAFRPPHFSVALVSASVS